VFGCGIIRDGLNPTQIFGMGRTHLMFGSAGWVQPSSVFGFTGFVEWVESLTAGPHMAASNSSSTSCPSRYPSPRQGRAPASASEATAQARRGPALLRRGSAPAPSKCPCGPRPSLAGAWSPRLPLLSSLATPTGLSAGGRPTVHRLLRRVSAFHLPIGLLSAPTSLLGGGRLPRRRHVGLWACEQPTRRPTGCYICDFCIRASRFAII